MKALLGSLEDIEAFILEVESLWMTQLPARNRTIVVNGDGKFVVNQSPSGVDYEGHYTSLRYDKAKTDEEGTIYISNPKFLSGMWPGFVAGVQPLINASNLTQDNAFEPVYTEVT